MSDITIMLDDPLGDISKIYWEYFRDICKLTDISKI